MASKLRFLGVTVLAVAMVAALGGCRGNGNDAPLDPGLTASERPSDTGRQDRTVREKLPELDAEWIFTEARGLQKVYFDYDSYALRSDALATLRENAEKIQSFPNVVIQIEGHCDERGTQEYNLALGERRALATREHLINLGISPNRLITISYGEEDPVALGHDEGSWRQNRRCEFNRAM